MAGIERLKIVDTMSGRGQWRFIESQKRWNVADTLYQKVFDLEDDSVLITELTKDELKAKRDIEQGIDIILTFLNGTTATLQEKILMTNYHTVTVEYMNNPRKNIPGDWFHMQAQYYAVIYSRGGPTSIDEYIILNWPNVAIQINDYPWELVEPRNDGAMANFKACEISHFGDDVVIAAYHSIPGAGMVTRGKFGYSLELKEQLPEQLEMF